MLALLDDVIEFFGVEFPPLASGRKQTHKSSSFPALDGGLVTLSSSILVKSLGRHQ